MMRMFLFHLGMGLAFCLGLSPVLSAAGPSSDKPTALVVRDERADSTVRLDRRSAMALRSDAAVGVADERNANSDSLPAKPSLIDRGRVHALLMPADRLKSVGSFPTGAQAGFSFLEIQVSHSQHTLKLFGHSALGRKEVLHECRVGLGAREFPTPVGSYFVTHIYDEEPWWIPPPNRAWAWGQSPSRRVYGGTMAPLLKKRAAKSKKASSTADDFIEGPVRLDDYGYRFHGTNAPRSIGRNESHGCVRMLPQDAQKVASVIKEHVGVTERRDSENGTYVVLRAPVRLNIVR